MEDANREDPRIARTRTKVLDAARQLLLDVGFLEVTINDISARSGVSPSTLYRHWDTREEILRDAFSEVALGDYSPQRNLLDDLHHYARTFADGLENSWGRAAATLATTAPDDPEQRKMMQTFIDGYTADMAQILRYASDRGEKLEPYTPTEVADSLVGPLFYRYLIRGEPLDHHFVADQANRVHRQIAPGVPI